MKDFKLEWHGRELIAEIEDVCRAAVKSRARAVARDAKGLVAVDTGGLRDSIQVKSWEKPGVFGAYISAGEKGKEHIAGFVELGTPGEVYVNKRKKGKPRTPIEAKPYLRPALEKNRRKFKMDFVNKLKK